MQALQSLEFGRRDDDLSLFRTATTEDRRRGKPLVCV